MPSAVQQDLRSLFVDAFRRQADTVCLVTYVDLDGRQCGMTATAVCSVTADPPMLVVCINRSTRTFNAITASERFAVNVLSRGQQHVASHCAIPHGDKSLEAGWLSESSRLRMPKVAHATAYIDCDVDAAHEHGTHAVLVGMVQDVEVATNSHPLLYFAGTFQELETVTSEPRPEAWWVS